MTHFERELKAGNQPAAELVRLKETILQTKQYIESFGGTELEFSDITELSELVRDGKFLIAYFDANRTSRFNVPMGINKVNLLDKPSLDEREGNHFLQYIVNLKADRSFARDDGDNATVVAIDNWFERLLSTLRDLFNQRDLDLRFDRSTYSFQIVEPNKKVYDFNQLSSGYSAIFRMLTELLIRMESKQVKSYDLQGIVVVDEIEMHLHVDLQKKILPFLTSFFPRIQFILSTHSPFILNSLEETVIFDLERNTVLQNLSSFSYSALIESYFESDKYSQTLKDKVAELESLMQLNDPSEMQQRRIYELDAYLSTAPSIGSEELCLKLAEIRNMRTPRIR